MQKRVRYMHLSYTVPAEERTEVPRPCGFCSARLYLEGRGASEEETRVLAIAGPAAPDVLALEGPDAPPAQGGGSGAAVASEPLAKRPRTGAECVQQLLDLKKLLDAGLVSEPEFQELKARVLRGD